MAIQSINYIEGQDVANRARYWVRRRLNSVPIRQLDIDWQNVSSKTVWNLVTGQRDVTLTRLQYIAETLNCDVLDLLKPIPSEFETPRLVEKEDEE